MLAFQQRRLVKEKTWHISPSSGRKGHNGCKGGSGPKDCSSRSGHEGHDGHRGPTLETMATIGVGRGFSWRHFVRPILAGTGKFYLYCMCATGFGQHRSKWVILKSWPWKPAFTRLSLLMRGTMVKVNTVHRWITPHKFWILIIFSKNWVFIKPLSWATAWEERLQWLWLCATQSWLMDLLWWIAVQHGHLVQLKDIRTM